VFLIIMLEKKKKNTSIFYEKKLALSSKQSYLGCSRLS